MKIENSPAELQVLARDVLAAYDMTPDEMKIIQNNGLKTLWKVRHGDQFRCLKRLKHQREKALFTVYAQQYIAENGGKVPIIYPNRDGELITEHLGELFVLYEWIDGRDVSFSDPADRALALAGLAKFHISSIGYEPPAGAEISSKFGRWPEQYESMKRRMLKWKEEADLNRQYPSHRSYLDSIDAIIELADQTLAALSQSPYGVITATALSNSTLCHQDFGEGNVILLGEDLYVIDLDGVTYDLVIRDLRKIIGKSMEKQGDWTVHQIDRILSAYERYNPLSPEERELLKIDLLFPHWFFAKAKNLFKKNKPMKENEILRIGQLEAKKRIILQDWS